MTFAVLTQGEKFRLGLCEALNKRKCRQSMTVGQIQRAFPDPELCQARDMFPDPAVIEIQFPVAQAGDSCAVDETVLAVRSLCNVDTGQHPFFFDGDNGSDLPRKIKTDSGKAFKEVVNAVECTSFTESGTSGKISFGIIVPGNDDRISQRFDDETVTIKFFEVVFDEFGPGGPQNEGRNSAGAFVDDRNFGTGDLTDKSGQFLTGVTCRPVVPGDDHFAERFALGGDDHFPGRVHFDTAAGDCPGIETAGVC